MRFRAEQHLHRQSDIRTVREQGRRVDCRAFTLWWKRRDAPVSDAVAVAAPSRVCVIASTNAVGAAVRRNRAKRRLREVFRHQQHRVPAGCNLLLIARAAANTWPLAELETKFADACGQSRRLPAKPNERGDYYGNGRRSARGPTESKRFRRKVGHALRARLD